VGLAHLVAPMIGLPRAAILRRLPHWLKRIVRDRVMQFAAVGGLIFALAPSADDSRVSLSRGYLESLHTAQARRLGVARLSVERSAEVDRRALEDEMLYREAMRLGLDRDDGVVREHLIQKMLLLAEDLGGASREPTRDAIRGYFERTRDRWREGERVHAVHVFATQRDRGMALAGPVRAGDAAYPDTPPPLGEAFARSRDVRGTREDYAASYGDAFADAVFALPPREWSAPIESRFGWHLVKVLQHSPGAPAKFDDVYDRVRLEYAIVHRHEAIAHFLEQAFARYHVDVDGVPVRKYTPTERLALRSTPSQED
jgi:peptidyl-prolyl cis-trans isomerase C